MFNRCWNESFSVVALEIFNLNKSEVEEFLEVYKDILSDFSLMVDELSSGNCVVMAIQGESLVVNAIRKLCGPHDP